MKNLASAVAVALLVVSGIWFGDRKGLTAAVQEAAVSALHPPDLAKLFDNATAGLLLEKEHRRLSRDMRPLKFSKIDASRKNANAFGRITLPTLGGGTSEIDIATGANIYHWRVNGTDHLPPQKNWFSQYVDDVFQFVITRRGEGRKRREGGWRYKDPAFVHQAGSYANREVEGATNHYSPTIRHQLSDGRALYMLTWPQQAHVPERLRSNILALTRLSQTKTGLLRIENVVFNTGERAFDFVNSPWGGVRSTLFKRIRIDNAAAITIPTFKTKKKVRLDPRLGHVLWVDSQSRNGFALVPPVKWTRDDGERGRTRFRYGVAGGKKKKGQDRRDFSVASNTARINFEPGDTMYLRYYLGYGEVKALEAAVARYNGKLAVQGGQSHVKGAATSCVVGVASSAAGCKASAELRFSQGSRPVFLFEEDAQHPTILSDDPYRAAFAEWDRKGREEPDDFLGFVYPGDFTGLCDQLGLAPRRGDALLCLAR